MPCPSVELEELEELEEEPEPLVTNFQPWVKLGFETFVASSTLRSTVFDVKALILYFLPGSRIFKNLKVASNLSVPPLVELVIVVVAPIDWDWSPFSKYKVTRSSFKKASSLSNSNLIVAESVVTSLIVVLINLVFSAIE
ncbi:hypothetical protein [Mesomycoplasma ovipneumoniae]|uniref:hypothetical protein n=1 Tax=Mesomycoplasma ovipneumoniae TaxID=29562 RepID=UPI00311ADD15